MANRVFVSDNKSTRGSNAHMPQVQAAVDAKTLEIAAIAEALFASHDHPGGHRIEVDKAPPKDDPKAANVDGLVSLVGPAPLPVEFGHFAGPEHEPGREFVKGLHILSRAAGL